MKFEDFEFGLGRQTFSMQDTYWIVDYTFCDTKNKIVRHIPPTEVFVFDKNVNLSGKYIISTDYYFKKRGKTGIPLSNIIQAYRVFNSEGVHVFASEQEAESFYKEQCEKVLEEIRIARNATNKRFIAMDDVALKRLRDCP